MAKDNTIDYYLKTAWQSVANSYNQAASKVGLTQASGYVLINIHKEGTAVSQIASLLGVRSTSLSRMLSAMEKQGLIYREVSELDKRSVKVFLTTLGVEKREMAKGIVRDFNDYLVAHMSESERLKLESSLIKINQLSQKFFQDHIKES
ncbi:MarR family winged helix-turn-helix transcriptional regulator [Albibacterium bauzanense]|uniref:DNA-binding MarR family transcriptional regulator n=1 Tax=Albibacterium bauzanense TaxID=653929 RepID=A0A4R1M7H2_9SPHI|nr:MarR family transcriptional regulator [Albibacterium bauzanense]TCK85789.1 DNA-binding MarR family transcriptional regulator [Albibacterium bauzanense]